MFRSAFSTAIWSISTATTARAPISAAAMARTPLPVPRSRQAEPTIDGTASTAAGRRAVRRLLAEEGVRLGDSVFDDGSGLSRANLAEPRTLVDVLRLAASEDHPDLRAVVTGLPVAGFDGSLADSDRFDVDTDRHQVTVGLDMRF